MPLTTSQKKRKVLEGFQGKAGRPNKKFRKQREYHSSSDEASDAEEPTDFKAVNLADSDDGAEKVAPKKTTKKQARKLVPPQKAESDDEEEQSGSNASSDADDDEDDDADSDASLPTGSIGQRSVPKRNDPTAFSTSISKILATKLPTSARADPVLSRSKIVTQTSTDLAEEKLDNQARSKLRAEKKEELDRGRVRDVLGIGLGQSGAVAEEEKRLRKIAQRGVVKLFNAVRAAQVRGEEAAKEERKKGTVGMGEREKTVNQVSKQGFLELINGKKGKPLNIEEA
ncbi:Rrp15p-domain-containing protein [Aspergillus carlsbadensis]|nr:Rrp15p-domain-containing protein [Aspergillus carlsbadensis]